MTWKRIKAPPGGPEEHQRHSRELVTGWLPGLCVVVKPADPVTYVSDNGRVKQDKVRGRRPARRALRIDLNGGRFYSQKMVKPLIYNGKKIT